MSQSNKLVVAKSADSVSEGLYLKEKIVVESSTKIIMYSLGNKSANVTHTNIFNKEVQYGNKVNV